MFAEWELIGVPHRVTIGDRGLAKGEVEYTPRKTLVNEIVPAGEIADFIKGKLA
jgi:prolyl-tRNA synthetase